MKEEDAEIRGESGDVALDVDGDGDDAPADEPIDGLPEGGHMLPTLSCRLHEMKGTDKKMLMEQLTAVRAGFRSHIKSRRAVERELCENMHLLPLLMGFAGLRSVGGFRAWSYTVRVLLLLFVLRMATLMGLVEAGQRPIVLTSLLWSALLFTTTNAVYGANKDDQILRFMIQLAACTGTSRDLFSAARFVCFIALAVLGLNLSFVISTFAGAFGEETAATLANFMLYPFPFTVVGVIIYSFILAATFLTWVLPVQVFSVMAKMLWVQGRAIEAQVKDSRGACGTELQCVLVWEQMRRWTHAVEAAALMWNSWLTYWLAGNGVSMLLTLSSLPFLHISPALFALNVGWTVAGIVLLLVPAIWAALVYSISRAVQLQVHDRLHPKEDSSLVRLCVCVLFPCAGRCVCVCLPVT
eukprot:PLAT9390.1.p1 GENE.PLAT9390.1~~PLAT9390.1.p1  ORF type:complete len:437 (-),score=155.49 PLAT9390.1:19-1254(-)